MSSKYSGPPLPLKMKNNRYRPSPPASKPPPQKQADQLRQQLSTLPFSPVPAYQLQLTRNGDTVVLDVWQLCFQVCFVNYAADTPAQV